MRGFLALLTIAAIGIAIHLLRDSDDAPIDRSPVQKSRVPVPRKASSESEKRARMWSKTDRSEQLIFRLTDSLRDLTFAVLNLEFPDERSRRQFWKFEIENGECRSLRE